MAVWTHANAEFKAQRHLLDQGFQVYLPCYRRPCRHARTTRMTMRPLFPRYLFCRPGANVVGWRPIMSTPGVARLVSRGDVPDTIGDDVIDCLRAREDGDGFIAVGSTTWRQGQKVAVAGLEGMEAVFQCVDDRQRALLLMDFLGSRTRIRVPVDRLVAI